MSLQATVFFLRGIAPRNHPLFLRCETNTKDERHCLCWLCSQKKTTPPALGDGRSTPNIRGRAAVCWRQSVHGNRTYQPKRARRWNILEGFVPASRGSTQGCCTGPASCLEHIGAESRQIEDARQNRAAAAAGRTAAQGRAFAGITHAVWVSSTGRSERDGTP